MVGASLGYTVGPQMSHFDHLLSLLELERAEQRRRFAAERAELSLQERAHRGLVELDVETADESVGLGGRLLLWLERADKRPFSMPLHPGDIVALRPRKAEVDESVQAVVSRVGRVGYQVAFEREPPPYVREGRLLVELMPNEVSFDRARGGGAEGRGDGQGRPPPSARGAARQHAGEVRRGQAARAALAPAQPRAAGRGGARARRRGLLPRPRAARHRQEHRARGDRGPGGRARPAAARDRREQRRRRSSARALPRRGAAGDPRRPPGARLAPAPGAHPRPARRGAPGSQARPRAVRRGVRPARLRAQAAPPGPQPGALLERPRVAGRGAQAVRRGARARAQGGARGARAREGGLRHADLARLRPALGRAVRPRAPRRGDPGGRAGLAARRS